MRINHWIGLLIIAAILTIPTLFLISKEYLVASTDGKSLCLQKNSVDKHLCATCINRNELNIFKKSNIIVESESDFKVMQIEKAGFLQCRQILHLISYQIPMQTASHIHLEVLDKVKELKKLVGISLNPYQQKIAQIGPQIGQIAILSIQDTPKSESTPIKFAPREAVQTIDSSIQIISIITLLYSIITGAIAIAQDGELKTLPIGSLCISTMVFSSTTVPNANYFTNYSVTILLLIFITKAQASRFVAFIVFCGSFWFSTTIYLPLCFFASLLLFRASLSSDLPAIQSRFISIILLTLTLISFAEIVGQEYLPSPLCTLWFYIILCMTPLLLHLMSPPSLKKTYEKVPQGSGISLPGMEQNMHDEQQN